MRCWRFWLATLVALVSSQGLDVFSDASDHNGYGGSDSPTLCDDFGVQLDPSISSLLQVTTKFNVKQIAKARGRGPPSPPSKAAAVGTSHANEGSQDVLLALQQIASTNTNLLSALDIHALSRYFRDKSWTDPMVVVAVMLMVLTPVFVAVFFGMFLLNPLHKRSDPAAPFEATGQPLVFSNVFDAAQSNPAATMLLPKPAGEMVPEVLLTVSATRLLPSSRHSEEPQSILPMPGDQFRAPRPFLPVPVDEFRAPRAALEDLPVQLLNPTMVVKQQEGLTLTLCGPELLPMPQQVALEVELINGGDTRVMFNVLCAEEKLGGNRGILIQSVQHFPIAFLDTGKAVGETTIAHYAHRCVNIYDHIPDPSHAEHSYIQVSQISSCMYRVVPVSGIVHGEPYFNIRFTHDSANFMDSSGKLHATMHSQLRDSDNSRMLVFRIAHNVDASIILSAAIAVMKLYKIP